MSTVIPSPTFDEINRAADVYRKWQLHYYQLLWFHNPKLTTPGRPGSPLSVEFDPDYWGCLKIAVLRNADFNFKVLMYLHGKTQEEYDADFLRKANMIIETLSSGKAKIDSRACCPLATIRGCVCMISFDCEIHGQRCIGTHD